MHLYNLNILFIMIVYLSDFECYNCLQYDLFISIDGFFVSYKEVSLLIILVSFRCYIVFYRRLILFYAMWDNCSFKYRIMSTRRRPPCDFNHDPRPDENGEGELPPPPPPPPYNDGIHPALIQFIVDTTRHFTEAISQIPQPNERAEPIGCSLCDFASYHFQNFEGTEGPNATEAWLTDIDVLFNTLGYTDEQKVRFIALQLAGETGRWRNARKVLLGDEMVITWEMFKVEYNRRFFPRAQRQLWAIEFKNLVQGNMIVEQYSARFMELARFTANLIPNEESKAERFKNGLNPRIKERVISLEIKDYARLVEVASLAERGIRESATAYDLKKCSKQQMTHPAKRLAIGSGSKPTMGKNFLPIIKNQRAICSKCSRTHKGDCRQGTSTCFKCGKPGHFLKDCPMNAAGGTKSQGSGTQVRVYSLTPRGVEEEKDEGEEENMNVVTGTIPLFGKLASTLFDSGVTHSFISSTYVKLCSMITQPLNQNITISTPAGDVVTCRKLIENCPIVIRDRVLPANLAVFQMLGFDIILGMNWLSK